MMNRPFPFSRTTLRAMPLVLGAWALTPAATALAFTPAKGGGENTPLNVSPTQAAGHVTASSGGGPSIVRTIVGLVIVLAVIWGLTWILKQVKSGRETRSAGTGLESVATLPLGSGRSLHLVRAGNDHLLVGSAEQGVVPVFRYSEEQARAAGLLDEEGKPAYLDPEHPDPGRASIQIPGHNEGLLERLREWTVRR
jgi:flagellar protein FliO/FliZ